MYNNKPETNPDNPEHQYERLKLENSHYRKLIQLMLLSQDQERKQFAVTLHDEVSQHLSLIKMNAGHSLNMLKAGRSDVSRDVFNNIISNAHTALHCVRTLARQLRPASLDDIGIVATMRALCREFEEENPDIVIDQFIDLDECNIQAALKTVLYRVVQEILIFLSNHTQTNHILLKLFTENMRLNLSIASNAITTNPDLFKVNEVDSHSFLLHLIKERVEGMQGQCLIEINNSQPIQIDIFFLFDNRKLNC